MTHRLQESTRLMTLATSGAAVVAAVDVLDHHGLTPGALGVAGLLLLGALLGARLHGVALEVGEVVVLRNVLGTRRVPAEEVVEIRPGTWRSLVVLADGTEIPTLLSDRDLAASTAHRSIPATAH